MKTKLLSALAAVAAFLTVLAGLDLSGIVHAMPDTWATGLATILPSLAGVVHFLRMFGDAVDNGKIDGSFFCAPLAFVLALVISLMATSCSNSVPWYVSTPYGDARGDADGVTITPNVRPIVIPSK